MSEQGPTSPISKSAKWGRLKNPPKDTPRKQDLNKTHVSLEYTLNPNTQEMTNNVRLVVVLRAGLKDPKGFMSAAWEGARLRETIQYCTRPIPIVHARTRITRHFSCPAGITKAQTRSRSSRLSMWLWPSIAWPRQWQRTGARQGRSTMPKTTTKCSQP